MAGMGDEMIKEQIDENGVTWGSYGFINDDEWKKVQPKNAPQILYAMRASASLKSDVNATAYTRMNGGLVRFLISE